jgi:hypothetical protein
MIVQKNFRAALLLDFVVPHSRTPADHGLLIAPTRKRENPPLAGEAAVADIVDKSIHLLQLGPEHFGIAEIAVPLLGLRMNFKYY